MSSGVTAERVMLRTAAFVAAPCPVVEVYKRSKANVLCTRPAWLMRISTRPNSRMVASVIGRIWDDIPLKDVVPTYHNPQFQ